MELNYLLDSDKGSRKQIVDCTRCHLAMAYFLSPPQQAMIEAMLDLLGKYTQFLLAICLEEALRSEGVALE